MDSTPAPGRPPHRPGAVQVTELPLDFEAFYLRHLDVYLEYAQRRIGDPATAADLVHQVFLYLLSTWDEVLVEPNLSAHCWDVLRSAIGYELRRSTADPTFTERITFARAMLLSREWFAAQVGDHDLFRRIAELPPRQFDVVVLKYVMGRPVTEIAWLLGLSTRTVDYHARKARERLAVLVPELHLSDNHYPGDHDEDVRRPQDR
ncbi:sigma-70 family RNA polymerase sigma factor [Kitasatospora sp. NPDC048365]|uniref:sigma-70 family RNA polymerase sigma factor n=1 Tax=Kitasatospora sp. NPDC048365 TaxID=3364050 RepID=UPI003716C29B